MCAAWKCCGCDYLLLAARGHYHVVQHQHVLPGAFKPPSDPDNTAPKSRRRLHFRTTRAHARRHKHASARARAGRHARTHTCRTTNSCLWRTCLLHSAHAHTCADTHLDNRQIAKNLRSLCKKTTTNNMKLQFQIIIIITFVASESSSLPVPLLNTSKSNSRNTTA